MSISYEKKEEIKQAREESNQTPPSLQIIYILHTDWSLPWSWCSKCSSPISFFFLVSPQWRTQIKLNRSKVIDYNGNSSEANVDMLDHTQKSAAATTNEHFVWEKIATDGRRLTFTSSKNKWRCYLFVCSCWLANWLGMIHSVLSVKIILIYIFATCTIPSWSTGLETKIMTGLWAESKKGVWL